MMQSRTHNCGELRIEDAGKSVTLVGWLENMREVGSGLGFVVLRDFYGTTQIVLDTEEMVKTAKAINKESTISVKGVVRERSSKNPKQATVISRLFLSQSRFLADVSTTSFLLRSITQERPMRQHVLSTDT